MMAQYGHFVMQWQKRPDGVWLIDHCYRVPLPESWTPPTQP